MNTSSNPDLPAMRGVFVTATDTEVGKTVIAGAIAKSLNAEGVRTEVFKPAASGCHHAGGDLVSEDAEFLAACADSARPLNEIAPLRYRAALAPNVAAQRAGREVDIEAMLASYRRLEGKCDAVVVEGVGGLLCPISDDLWVIHLALMMQLPVVIVARPDLGTINHTLLTIHAARSAGLHVAGVIINRYQIDPNQTDGPDDVIAMMTNPAQIAEKGQVPILALAPDDPQTSVSKSILGPDVSYAIDQVDWKSIIAGA
ncbi:MAG: dethiobiotin synthase [Phycisphaerales bacterium]|jgi:dethiobiotin synthetase|nr:dethiobiotin synthase [Phycisphaerales bacterium]